MKSRLLRARLKLREMLNPFFPPERHNVNCKGVIRELSSYLEGDLDVTVLSEFEVHLTRCDDCRLIVDTTRKTIDIYCKAEPVPLPEDVRTRLHNSLMRLLGPKPDA